MNLPDYLERASRRINRWHEQFDQGDDQVNRDRIRAEVMAELDAASTADAFLFAFQLTGPGGRSQYPAALLEIAEQYEALNRGEGTGWFSEAFLAAYSTFRTRNLPRAESITPFAFDPNDTIKIKIPEELREEEPPVLVEYIPKHVHKAIVVELRAALEAQAELLQDAEARLAIREAEGF